jgi:hypothetical protein
MPDLAYIQEYFLSLLLEQSKRGDVTYVANFRVVGGGPLWAQSEEGGCAAFPRSLQAFEHSFFYAEA